MPTAWFVLIVYFLSLATEAAILTAGDPPLTSKSSGTVEGQVRDPSGGVIVEADVQTSGGPLPSVRVLTDEEGHFQIGELPAGSYRLVITAPGFASYRSESFRVEAGRAVKLNIQLQVAPRQEEITVISPDSSGRLFSQLGTLILTGEALEALPETSGGLAATLRLLAPRSSGPRGPEVTVDGFRQRGLPRKDAIREIRINENPFSAEYSQPGLSRVEILTKPGTGKFQGSLYLTFNNQSLNSRNPFASHRPPHESRLLSGNFGGSLIPGRAGFFIDAERHEIDNNALINATILDSDFNIQPLNLAALSPEVRTRSNPRFDFRLSPNHTMVVRFRHDRLESHRAGIGDFSLPSRAYRSFKSDAGLQLTETAVFGSNLLNETRFQYSRLRNLQEGDNQEPAIHVPQAFSGGGSQIGLQANHEHSWELQNYTLRRQGRHLLKAGIQIQVVRLRNISSANFGGSYTFAGGLAPLLDDAGGIVPGPKGEPIQVSISTIERYRRTLVFLNQGLPASEIRALGGGAHQFSISAGEKEARVGQYEVGLFLQDDWNIRRNLSLSLGLRYECQNNIPRCSDLAPRIGFAWTPETASGKPKTVVRAGSGVFYDRFSHTYTLRAVRFNGLKQQEFIVSDPEIVDLFPAVPSREQLDGFQLQPAVVRVAHDLRTPLTLQSTAGIDQSLPLHFSLAASFVNTRSFHALRSRNINAPILNGPGTVSRPLPGLGEIFQYESSSSFKENQLIVNVTNRLGKALTGYVTYILGRARSDTDGAESFPADSNDLSREFGPSLLDARHRLFWGAWIEAPGGWRITPLYVYRSGLPFNIITGIDANGDSLYLERPALATDLSRPGVVMTRLGAFDLHPEPGQEVIPRNWGRGFSFSSLGLSVSKTFSVGSHSDGSSRASPDSSGRWNRRFNLILSAQIENLFNRVNPGTPVGNLSSRLFGESLSAAGAWGFGNNPAGNRQVVIRFHFRF